MKIVCEACQAKYSIADDKVRGKVFKIRCKKCSHVIVVRGTTDGTGAASGELAPPGGAAAADTSSAEAAWHIVVDGEQVGPLPESDIRGRLGRGEVSGDTFIWKEGMADWVKISSLPEFASGGAGGEAGPLFGENGAEANPFAQSPSSYPGAGAGAFAAESTRSEPDAFGAPAHAHAPAAAAMPDLFASPSGAAAEAHSPLGGFGGFDAGPSGDPFAAPPRAVGNGAGMASNSSSLTGQRHENSVLFSLSNLEALAKPSPAPMPVSAQRPGHASPVTEGSGLIDIRAMASMTLGASSGPSAKSDASDLPAFSAPQFSPVAPVLLPVSHSGGMPGWAKITLGALALVFVALAAVIIKLLMAPAAPAPAPVVAQPSIPTAPSTAPGVQSPPATRPVVTTPPPPPENLPPREAPVAAAGDKGGDKGDHHAGKAPAAHTAPGTKRPGGKAPEAAPERPVAAAPAPRPEPAPAAREKPAAPEDEITRLIKGATSSSSRPAPTAARPEPEARPEKAAASLGSEDIVKGMNGIMPKTRECFNQYKVPGLAMVNVTVDPRGKVSAANVGGKFAGTPTGGCIESAVKSAKFPPSAGLNFKWPVNLH
jgi:predicted Zn finger-like uncharacterized protein